MDKNFNENVKKLRNKIRNKKKALKDFKARLESNQKKLDKTESELDKAVGLNDTKVINDISKERRNVEDKINSLRRNIKNTENVISELENEGLEKARNRDKKTEMEFLTNEINKLGDKLIPEIEPLKSDIKKLVKCYKKLSGLQYRNSIRPEKELKYKIPSKSFGRGREKLRNAIEWIAENNIVIEK
ncbi:MAG: hypothetical protein K9N00_04110 [Candidatus Marinimicrobia bacterium]|nr:hypothetical protein [Candidatus Neomarinimicrobiota bacterium]